MIELQCFRSAQRAVGNECRFIADDGQTTAVTKRSAGEIVQQQSKFILEEISYRSDVT
jgi:hypothetical protein